MQKVRLKKILADHKLDPGDAARVLFPEAKHPHLAFRRALKGVTILNADQLSRIASYLNVSIGSLFTGEGWTCKTQGKTHVFTYTDGTPLQTFTAHVDMEAGILKIFHDKTLFHMEFITDPTTPLVELIELLNLKITKYNEDQN